MSTEVVKDIFYFGVPKDGFRVYPNAGSASNVFSGYHTNTATDWQLVIRKLGNTTRYVYVRYGLLTSAVNGRAGSCFGISIDLKGYYFSDPIAYKKEVIDNIWGAIMHDGVLLDVHESSGILAFKSFDLQDEIYLNTLSEKIRQDLFNKKLMQYMLPLHEIPDPADHPIAGFHPDSSPNALREYFKFNGAIKISPNFQIESKSLSEKKEEDIYQLKAKVNDLTSQLRQKEREIDQIRNEKATEIAQYEKQKNTVIQNYEQKLDRISGIAKNLFVEFPQDILRIEASREPAKPFSNQGTLGGRESSMHVSPPTINQYLPMEKKSNFMVKAANFRKKHKVVSTVLLSIGGVLFLALMYYGFSNWFFDGRKEPPSGLVISKPQAVPTKLEPSPIIAIQEKEDNGKLKKFLKTSAFLETNQGITITSENDLKQVLTTFLMKNDAAVSTRFNGSGDDLWKEIVRSNPTSMKGFTDLLSKKGPLIITNNQEQQDLFKNLIIYSQ